MLRLERLPPLFFPSWRRLSGWLIRLGLFLGLGLVGMNLYVTASTEPHSYRQLTQVPHQRVVLVFGAGIRADGRLTRVLADRVEAAIALYQAGRVQKLLLTGDNSSQYYDEVSAMRRYALERGVAATDVILDYAGFSTYESCYRAQAIFGLQEAVLVTQQYHLPRALYTCQQLGVAAVGYGVDDWGVYPAALMSRFVVREALATAKALWQVHVTRPAPTFLGPVEAIN
jgi:vancomycin permeability regulator SanA